MSSATQTVLLVDDEQAVRSAVAALLEHLGYSVLHAADGQEAIDVLRDKADEVELVLMDARMPRMDAKTAVPLIYERWPQVPILLSSGNEVDVDAASQSKHNIVGFLSKPYMMKDLDRAVATAIAAAHRKQTPS